MKKLLFSIAIASLLSGNFFIVFAAEPDANPGNFNAPRIEEEDKILVPDDKVSEVWAYLEEHFIKDQTFLTAINPKLSCYFNLEDFRDTYFDTPDLKLLSQKNGIRHRVRTNLTNPEDVKNERELVQIKLSGVTADVLDREEYKYPVKIAANINTAEESHPLLGLVDKDFRQQFKDRVISLGLEPMSLQPILTVNDHRHRVYILYDKKPYTSISLDEASANVWWVKINFTEIEPEISEIALTGADEKTKAELQSVNGKIIEELKAKLPYLKSDLTPKYNKSFDRLEEKLPDLRFLVKYDLQSQNVLYSIASLAGLAALAVILGLYFLIKRLVFKQKE